VSASSPEKAAAVAMAKSPASASLTAVSWASAGRSHPLFRLTWKPVQKLECARAIERVGRPTLVAAGSRRADAPSARHGDRVGAGHEARRRLPLACELDQRAGELGGVTALAVVHGVPAAMVCLVRSAWSSGSWPAPSPPASPAPRPQPDERPRRLPATASVPVQAQAALAGFTPLLYRRGDASRTPRTSAPRRPRRG
jgi:hypothetical protein